MILDPPAIHDHPYAGQVIEHRLSVRGIEIVCGRGKLACSWPSLSGSGPCYVWLPVKASAALWRHERAHCNGWEHR